MKLNRFYLLAAIFIAASSAHAATPYETTFELVNGQKVVHDWSTNLTSGSIGAADLQDWTMTWFDSGGGVLYSDTIIVGGTVQPWGNSTRPTSDPFFSYDFSTNVLDAFHNQDATPFNNIVGTEWRISKQGGDPNLRFAPFTSAGIQPESTVGIASQTTVVVPEPASLALLALGGLVLRRRHRGAAPATERP